eukprot:TRINITY_DN2524_c0_g2_i1.p1 TRINITY_DN2524_c0_g2~~TRINITY_DN2524_c0_g2_i1.p1  ORF type:complete len:456 (+),score=63.20 TRINITY_DN2524_c0_g2_i1:48-1415(+)
MFGWWAGGSGPPWGPWGAMMAGSCGPCHWDGSWRDERMDGRMHGVVSGEGGSVPSVSVMSANGSRWGGEGRSHGGGGVSRWDAGAPNMRREHCPSSASRSADEGVHGVRKVPSKFDRAAHTEGNVAAPSRWDEGAPRSASSHSRWDEGAPRGGYSRWDEGPLAPGGLLHGTVKSYNSVKGFGFIVQPDMPGDIWFSRDGLDPTLRSSELTGKAVCFEPARAPDGKPQARNLRLLAGTSPGTSTGAASVGPGALGASGMISPGGEVRPGLVHQQKRAFSPHAGSRAIAGVDAPRSQTSPPQHVSSSRSASRASSKSSKSRRTSRSVTSLSSSTKKRKKKKKKKKRSQRSRSRQTRSTISSSSSRSRSRSRNGDKRPKTGDLLEQDSQGSDQKQIEMAKREALAKLTKLQGIEPKEERAKQWRALLRAWHPDKNPEKVDVATAVFQFLQKGKSLINI